MLCINPNDQLLITFSGSQKLGLPKKGHILVLETDGTEIDDDKILLEMQSETLIILMEGESWIPQIPTEEQVSITSIEQKSDSEKINEIISLDTASYMEYFANRSKYLFMFIFFLLLINLIFLHIIKIALFINEYQPQT